jgi:hypothetical protein
MVTESGRDREGEGEGEGEGGLLSVLCYIIQCGAVWRCGSAVRLLSVMLSRPALFVISCCVLSCAEQRVTGKE